LNTKTAQELILYSDSDAHISEDEIFPHENHSKKEEMKTDSIQWTDNTPSQPSAPLIHRFTLVSVG
jgi:hypothetical protein